MGLFSLSESVILGTSSFIVLIHLIFQIPVNTESSTKSDPACNFIATAASVHEQFNNSAKQPCFKQNYIPVFMSNLEKQ